MRLQIETPTTTPIVYAEAKSHLRLDTDTELTYIESLIDVATAFAEGEIEGLLVQRTVTLTHYSDEHCGKFLIPKGPVASITSVVDANDDAITDYDIVYVGNNCYIKVNESFELPLVITYEAGYAVTEYVNDIPADIRHALLIHVASLYQNRETHSRNLGDEVKYSLGSIYNRYRRSEFIG